MTQTADTLSEEESYKSRSDGRRPPNRGTQVVDLGSLTSAAVTWVIISRDCGEVALAVVVETAAVVNSKVGLADDKEFQAVLRDELLSSLVVQGALDGCRQHRGDHRQHPKSNRARSRSPSNASFVWEDVGVGLR